MNRSSSTGAMAFCRRYLSIVSLVLLLAMGTNVIGAEKKCDPAKLNASRVEEEITQEMKDGNEVARINKIASGKESRKEALAYYPQFPGFVKRALGAAGLLVAGAFGLDLVHQFLQMPNPFTAVAALAAGFLGIAASDRVNAEIHWGLDQWFYGTKNKFLLQMARDARQHHEYPTLCLNNTYLGRVGEFAGYTIPVMAATAGLLHSGLGNLVDAAFGLEPGSISTGINVALGSFVGMFALSSMHGTATHQWAHTPVKQLGWVPWLLQKAGLAVSTKNHMLHHKPPFDHVYSTQSGWFMNDPVALNARMRKMYETTGRFPGSWIQDPSSIPADIREKLIAQYQKDGTGIPPELTVYAPTAYPKRVPAEFKKVLEDAGQKWRWDFIARANNAHYTDLRDGLNPNAEKDWIAFQQKYPWIFGPDPKPLRSDIDADKPPPADYTTTLAPKPETPPTPPSSGN